MLPNPEIWRGITPGRRFAIWMGVFCVLVALWGGYFWSGPWQAKREEGAQVQRQLASLTAQRRLLWLREKALPRSMVDGERLAMPFSALHFQSAETSLVSWTPDTKGGELVLETRWLLLPALFYQLAEREMTPVAFTIQPEGRLLRFRLSLEAFREP